MEFKNKPTVAFLLLQAASYPKFERCPRLTTWHGLNIHTHTYIITSQRKIFNVLCFISGDYCFDFDECEFKHTSIKY